MDEYTVDFVLKKEEAKPGRCRRQENTAGPA